MTLPKKESLSLFINNPLHQTMSKKILPISALLFPGICLACVEKQSALPSLFFYASLALGVFFLVIIALKSIKEGAVHKGPFTFFLVAALLAAAASSLAISNQKLEIAEKVEIIEKCNKQCAQKQKQDPNDACECPVPDCQ